MAILEILLKPLLDAQREAGREEGQAAGEAAGKAAATTAARAQFEAWKARQRAAGVEFVDDDELSEDPPEPAERSDSDA